MRKFVSALALGAGMIAATSASAQVTDVSVTTIDPGTDLEGFTANDILISFAGQYSGSQLLITLETGSLYRDPFGETTESDTDASPAGAPPNGTLVGLPGFESLKWDSFFDSGLPGGGAVDIDNSFGDTNTIPNETVAAPFTLTSAWNPPGGAEPLDLVDLRTARITLSDDATGTWSFISSANNEISDVVGGTVVNGALVIPEPTTAGLLGLAGLSLIARRRKTA